jgi:hypothetical protein
MKLFKSRKCPGLRIEEHCAVLVIHDVKHVSHLVGSTVDCHNAARSLTQSFHPGDARFSAAGLSVGAFEIDVSR